ncbi:MAG: hypothetical protein ACRD36_07640, partial [Candidatus Acidiferrum sp.]
MFRRGNRASGPLFVALAVLGILLGKSTDIGRAEAPATMRIQPPSPEPPLADRLAMPQRGTTISPVAGTFPPTPIVGLRVSAPSVIKANSELEYRILVENTSVAAAHHVLVRVPVPAAARFVSAKPEPSPEKANGQLAWRLGSMAGGSRREITVIFAPTGKDDMEFCARVSFEHGQCLRSRLPRAALQVRQTGPARALRYDVLNYVLEVTNSGSAEANDVVVTNQLPPGIEFSNSKPSTNGDNPLTWKLGNLGPGERRRIEFQVIGKENGTHSFKAIATAGAMKSPECINQVTVGEPKLTLVMTGPKQRSMDRPATYQLTVSNTGTAPVGNIQLGDDLFSTEQLRAGLELVGASDNGKRDGNNIRWQLDTLPAGARRTVNFTIRARQTGTFNSLAILKADRGVTAKASA